MRASEPRRLHSTVLRPTRGGGGLKTVRIKTVFTRRRVAPYGHTFSSIAIYGRFTRRKVPVRESDGKDRLGVRRNEKASSAYGPSTGGSAEKPNSLVPRTVVRVYDIYIYIDIIRPILQYKLAAHRNSCEREQRVGGVQAIDHYIIVYNIIY